MFPPSRPGRNQMKKRKKRGGTAGGGEWEAKTSRPLFPGRRGSVTEPEKERTGGSRLWGKKAFCPAKGKRGGAPREGAWGKPPHQKCTRKEGKAFSERELKGGKDAEQSTTKTGGERSAEWKTKEKVSGNERRRHAGAVPYISQHRKLEKSTRPREKPKKAAERGEKKSLTWGRQRPETRQWRGSYQQTKGNAQEMDLKETF